MNSNWARWIKRSIAKHFTNRSGGLDILIPGERRKRTESKDRLELKINGPNIKEGTKNFFLVKVNIAMLITVVSNEADIYAIDRYESLITKAFYTTLNVKDDSDNIIGSLVRKSDIITTSYEQDTLQQIIIDAYYSMALTYTYEIVEESVSIGTNLTTGES